MKRTGLVLVIAALGVLAAVLGWAIYASGALSFAAGSRWIVLIIVAGVVATGGLAGLFAWLAFYSERKGFDEGLEFDRPEKMSERDGSPDFPAHPHDGGAGAAR